MAALHPVEKIERLNAVLAMIRPDFRESGAVVPGQARATRGETQTGRQVDRQTQSQSELQCGETDAQPARTDVKVNPGNSAGSLNAHAICAMSCGEQARRSADTTTSCSGSVRGGAIIGGGVLSHSTAGNCMLLCIAMPSFRYGVYTAVYIYSIWPHSCPLHTALLSCVWHFFTTTPRI